MNICKYCNSERKNKNSLRQHEIRCPSNPNRISVYNSKFNKPGKLAWNKGLSRYTSESIRRQIESRRITIQNKGSIIHIWKSHNEGEINKWLQYIDSLHIHIPQYQTRINQGYKIIRGNCHKHTEGTHYIFEHKYIASLLLGELPKGSIIHHIDEDKLNNDIHNIMVFDTKGSHVMFHKSEYAYIRYDEITHLFTSDLKYP